MSYQTLSQYILWRPHLTALFNALHAAEIPFLILKGWALIPDLYPEPNAARPLGDIDILVPDDSFPAAMTLLHGLGYRPHSKHPEYGFDKASQRLPLEIAYLAPSGVAIDLHRHIYPADWSQPAYPIQMDAFWQSRQPFTDWAGNHLERLSPELNLIHLITHIARDGLLNASHKSYQDLIRLLEKYGPALDYGHIISLITAWHMRGMLFFVARFCRQTFQISFPSTLDSDWRPGRLRLFLIDRIITPVWKRRPNSEHWTCRVMLNLLLIENPRTALSLIWHVLFPTRDQRYHLHGCPITLPRHHLRLLRRTFSL